jgi:predicted metal-dependent hydrolase
MPIKSIEVIRSARRTRTVSARLRGDGVLEVRAPARMNKKDLDEAIASLRARIERKEDHAARARSDEGLEERARQLNRELFDGRLSWQSIRYVNNQEQRWGSCTSVDGTIRLSSRLRDVPEWVRDYVLVHEMAHLIHPDHSAAFWNLCGRYPLIERARGYLMALDHLRGGNEQDEEEW